MKSLFTSLCALSCLVVATTASGEMREWKSAGSDFRQAAEFVSATEREVRLKGTDGVVFNVELSTLSVPDQAYVAARTGREFKPIGPVLTPPVKKIERMEPLKIAEIVAKPDMIFEVDGFKGGVEQMIHGGAGMSVGGFSPAEGFGFGVLQIRLSPLEAPASTDVCGFYLESPYGTRYPVHLLVVASAGSEDGKRTLRDVRRMEIVATTDKAVIENTYVFMIPATADVREFRLGFATPDDAKKVVEKSN